MAVKKGLTAPNRREYNQDMSAVLLVRVKPDLAAWVRQQARKQERSVSWVLRQIIAKARG